jgi:cysteine desulfurase
MDYSATTPCDHRVLEAMLPYFTTHFGNPHSRNHNYGWLAKNAIESARTQIAHTINGCPKEIIFTSGATESNNLAIKGCARFVKKEYGRNQIVTTAIEHKCVLESVASLVEEEGFTATYIPINPDGLIDLLALENTLSTNATRIAIVSVLAVHNEIGVIQPLNQIGALCNKYGVYFHTDAAQAIGKIPIDVNLLGIDLLSISGHKIYGPKGIGALYTNATRKQKPRIRLHSLFSGGGQERGLRSGTLPTPGCVGLGCAMELAESERQSDYDTAKRCSSAFLAYLQTHLSHIHPIGGQDRAHYVPHILNIAFEFVEGESLMMQIPEIAVSSGSACTSPSLEGSYTLNALGVGPELAHTSLRFGFGRLSQYDEVMHVARRVVESVELLRSRSPLYEMFLEGIDLKAVKWSEGH